MLGGRKAGRLGGRKAGRLGGQEAGKLILSTDYADYTNCHKYVPIDLATLSKVIASEAKQSLRVCKRLLRRKAPRNDGFSEYIFENRYNSKEVLQWLLNNIVFKSNLK